MRIEAHTPQAVAPATVFTALLWALLLFLSTGCSKPQQTGKVQLTYWEKWTGAEAVALQEVVDRFNASQDRIHVNLVSTAQIDRKLIVATAGGTPPDLAGIWVPQISSFADRGALMPMDTFMQQDAKPGTNLAEAQRQFMDRYVPVYAKMSTHRGRVYALPTTPSVVALHWNKRLFREAGLDPERPPRTLAELDDYAKRMTKRDPQTGALLRVGFLPQEPGWWMWANVLWFGGSYIDEKGEVSIGTDPRNVEAFNWLRSYTEHFGKDDLQRFTSGFGSFGSPQAAFYTGSVGMVLQGVWMNNYIRQFAPGMEYGVAAWPALDDEALKGSPFTAAEADMIVIPAGAKHPREAWEFIRYLSSSNPKATKREEIQGMELLCLLQEKNSPLKEWSPAFVQHHPHPYIGLFRELSMSDKAVFVPQVGNWQEYGRELNAAQDRVRLLISTPEEELKYVQGRMVPSWRRHRDSVARQDAALAQEGGAK